MLREIHARHGVRNFPCTRITIGGHEPLNRVAQDGKGREVRQVMHAALEIPDGFVADIHAVQGVRDGCSGILGNMDEQNPTFTHPVGAFKTLGSGRIGNVERCQAFMHVTGHFDPQYRLQQRLHGRVRSTFG